MIFGSQFPWVFPFGFSEPGTDPLPSTAFPSIAPVYPSGTPIVDQQLISLRTYDGIQLYQFLPAQQTSLKWGRSIRQVSVAQVEVESLIGYDGFSQLSPWLHWISIWSGDGTSLLWEGPIQNIASTRATTTIKAADVAAYMAKTRIPITKDWDTVDPSVIASELWDHMIANHNLNITPIVRVDPEGSTFDYQVVADTGTVDSTIADLVTKGFCWSVVAGIPILGPAPKTPFTALCEDDFIGGEGITVTRDGTATFNDVLLHAADGDAQARVTLGDLNLQTVVNANTIFGPDNADKAVVQYAQYCSQMRDTVTVGNAVSLHPDAPITIEQMIPSARINLDAYGFRTLQQLDTVDVSSSSTGVTVSPTFEMAVDILDLPELARPDGSNGLGAVAVSTAP